VMELVSVGPVARKVTDLPSPRTFAAPLSSMVTGCTVALGLTTFKKTLPVSVWRVTEYGETRSSQP